MRSLKISLLLWIVIMLNSIAQVFMKAAAVHSLAHAVSGIFNTWFITAAVCLGISFLSWQALLRLKPVSFLHPFCSLNYVIVPALSAYFFQESVSIQCIIGICCIIVGICFTAASVSSEEVQFIRPRVIKICPPDVAKAFISSESRMLTW